MEPDKPASIDLCQGCEENPALDPHTCPFAEEIDNSDRECTCCEDCIQQCADDI